MSRTYGFDTMPTMPPPPKERRRRSLALPVLAVVVAILLTANVGTLLAWVSTSGRLDTTRHDLIAKENALRSAQRALDSTKQELSATRSELSERSASLHRALGTIDHARTCIGGMAKSFYEFLRSPLIGALTLKDDLDRIKPDCRAVMRGGGGGAALF